MAATDRHLFCQLDRVRREIRESQSTWALRFAAILGSLGLLARLSLLVISGNLPLGPLSGVGDQRSYQILADNLYEGRGFTYSGLPTALRPPLYPIFLAATRFLFGPDRFLAARGLQFLSGLAVACLCLLLARRLFGIEAGVLAGSFALGMPTLAFGATELQSEALAGFIALLFLCFLVAVLDGAKWAVPCLGLASGVAALVRFNSLILLAVATVACLVYLKSLRSVLLVWLLACLVLAPWIIRNARVFHGQILFSSQGGINLLQGVISPEGRAQDESYNRVRAAVGWSHSDLETNNASRLRFPNEDVLDRQARAAALQAWEKLSWSDIVRLLAGKITCFLFSTDQFLRTTAFSPKQRVLRAAGVVGYWVVLALAVLGWGRLFKMERSVALVLAMFLLVVTVAHLPFVMNTRLRIPFFDPLFTVLGGAGLSFLIAESEKRSGSSPPDASAADDAAAAAAK